MASNERIRSAVALRGFNNTTLAHALDIDPKTVQRWINEGRTPRRSAADRVATLLEVPAAHLWPELGPGFAPRGRPPVPRELTPRGHSGGRW